MTDIVYEILVSLGCRGTECLCDKNMFFVKIYVIKIYKKKAKRDENLKKLLVKHNCVFLWHKPFCGC